MTAAMARAEKNHSHILVMAPPGTELDPLVVDDLLQAAYRRRVVARFDSGQGAVCWFEGPPSPQLDALREEILSRARRVLVR